MASDPDNSNIVDGYYYGVSGVSIWRFDAANAVFEGAEFPGIRGRGSTISRDLIRFGSYVFDRQSDVFKHVSATILHDVGPYGFVEASQCPEQLPCRTLKAPLDHFAVLDLKVADYETPHTREFSWIEL